MRETITGERPFLKLEDAPPEVLACLILIPAYECRLSFQLLIRGGDPASILVADDREMAMEVMRTMRDREESVVTAYWSKKAYGALYRSVQAASVDSDIRAVSPEDGVILDVLGEKYSVCRGLKEALEKGNGLTSDDARPVHLLVQRLWEGIHPEEREMMAAIRPENLFSQL